MTKHCCEAMTWHVNHQCDVHRYPFDCPDHVVYYNQEANHYGLLIHDGGSSYYSIRYCPWCGSPLPDPDASDEEDNGL